MNMSGKDVLRLLLISYGFCRNIEISTYIGDGGWIVTKYRLVMTMALNTMQ